MVINSRILREQKDRLKEIFVTPDLYIFAAFLLSEGKGLIIKEELGSYRIHSSVSNLYGGSAEKITSTINHIFDAKFLYTLFELKKE